MLAQIRAWKAKGMKHFKLRPNYLCYKGWIPRGYERFFLENFKMNYREGMIGTDYDGSPRGEVTAFERYAIARAQQNPAVTFDQVEKEFLAQYGKAAPKMKAYFDRVRERNEKALYAKQRHNAGDKEVVLDDSLLVGTVLGANPTEELEKDAAILKEALETPGLSDAERRRVRAMAVLPRHAILTRDFQLSFDSEKTGNMAPDFAEKGLKLLDFRIKEVQSLITPVNWGPTFRTYPFEVKYWRQRPIKQHWENIEKASDPEFRPYLAMFGTPGSETAKAVRAVCVDGKTNIPQMLGAVKWDVVTIQQGSVASPFAEKYQPYADNLIATIRKHAPQAEILIQETWAYLPYHKRLGAWKMTQREMYERLHENYSALAKKTGFRVIPTGTAVQRYRAKLPPFRKLSKSEWDAIEQPNLPDICGDPCGVPKWHKPYRWEKGFDRDKVQLMIDSTHLNPDGEYLQACVWLSVLCGIDARKIGWTPEGLAPDRAALMRECAHEAVESAAAQPRKEVLASSFGWERHRV